MSTHGLRLRFEVSDDARGRPPPKVELAGFRIGQAAIDNALRHSDGEHVDVTVTSAPDRLEVTIRDDGVGIDQQAEQSARRSGRIGLAQMWVRADSVGGALDVRNHPDGGTEVRFVWSN
jgi:signal transduction histidine kinase